MQAVLETVQKYPSSKYIFSILLIYCLHKLNHKLKASLLMKKLAQDCVEKRRKRDLQIASEFTSPSEIREEKRQLILKSNVTKLVELLNDDQITSEEILKVYHSRAITVGLSLELIADSNYQEALEMARNCDEKRKRTPKEERHTLGNLFGIPISIKDSFIQKGLDSTCGQAVHCFKPQKQDGEILQLLKLVGAIPFIRTSVPQTLALLDCKNNIWGRGLNPWNNSRSVGGSSGGEGGMIAARCSPIGLGSDALGSIRIPASFCGVVGFKPTTGRYCLKGHSVIGPYAKAKFSLVNPNNGPIASCVDDAVLFTKALIRKEGREYDPKNPYIPWDEEKFKIGKLKIGYVLTEDFFGASKSCQRAVQETADALRAAGHTLAEVKIPSFEKLVLSVVMLLSSEGGVKGIDATLSGEEPINELKKQLNIRRVPDIFKTIMKSVLGLVGQTRAAEIIKNARMLTVQEYHAKVGEFIDARNEFLDFFVDNSLDAIVLPSLALPAFKHGFGSDLGIACCYNWPANCANMPAGVVPVTKVKEGEDVYTSKETRHNDLLTKTSAKAIEGSVGMPVSVQVVTLPWEDEKCLAVMKTIEDLVGLKELPDL